MHTSIKAYPPIGIALISCTVKRGFPSAFVCAFCHQRILERLTRKRMIQVLELVHHAQNLPSVMSRLDLRIGEGKDIYEPP